MSEELHKISGPLLLLAGPGTGKTYQLAKRIKFLVEELEIDPQQVAVITFTAAAAKNMRDRISDTKKSELCVSYKKQPSSIRTMHSLGHKIVQENASYFGLKDNINVVYVDKVRDILMSDAAQLAGYKRSEAKKTIECRKIGRCAQDDNAKCKICETYQKILRSCNTIDHDDQIMLACKALKKDQELLKKYQSQCKHLLVDEYQDINASQFELISILTKGQEDGLFVVGDDDQSIYSWRGGSPVYIRKFKEHFGNSAQIKTLNKSWRCHPNVLEGALSVVCEHDKGRLNKGDFEYEKEEGPKIQIHNVASEKKEALHVELIAKRVLPSQDVLVLIPRRGFLKEIINQLRKSRISYVAPPVQPGEGLPIISVLGQWLNNVGDSLAFRECLDAFVNNSAKSGVPSVKVRKEEKKQAREQALLNISNLWKSVIDGKNKNLWTSLQLSKENNELYTKLAKTFERIIDFKKQDNLAGFINESVDNLRPWSKPDKFIDEIQSWVELTGKSDNIQQTNSVQLMTLQGAKGLEADVVCVIGIEEGTLPNNTSDPEEIAEQSRLMFVSMTRAKHELHLFHARTRSGAVTFRNIYNKGRTPNNQKSRFIDSIKDEHKENKYHKA